MFKLLPKSKYQNKMLYLFNRMYFNYLYYCTSPKGETPKKSLCMPLGTKVAINHFVSNFMLKSIKANLSILRHVQ